MTRDIDLVVELGSGDTAKLMALFGDDYYISPDDVAEAVRSRSMFNLIHLESVIKVDCIVRQGSPFREAEFQRRQRITIEDFDVWIVSKEDLVLSKLFWPRDSHSQMQLQDVRNLMASGCDSAYLAHWAGVLGVAGLLAEVSA